MKNILRAFTFWIRSELRQECDAYLESAKLKELRDAPGSQRATALFRDLGDGTTEVVVVSVWDSMASIQAFEALQSPIVDPAVRHELFDREPTVRHYEISERSAIALMPHDWR